MFGYIYKTTNKINGKIYVGQHQAIEFEGSLYRGSGILLNRAISKYGDENFITELVEWCETKQILDEREKYYIKHYNSQNPSIGYNITPGGVGGAGPRSEETKRALSEFNKKVIVITDGVIEKRIFPCDLEKYELLGFHKGRKPFTRSEQFKEKQSIINKSKVAMSKDGVKKRVWKNDVEKYQLEGWVFGWSKPKEKVSAIIGTPSDKKSWMFDGENYYLVYDSAWEEKLAMGWIFKGKSKGKGRVAPNKGKKASPETRKKLSESHKGKVQSQESITKLSEKLKDRKYMHKDGHQKLVPKGMEAFYLSDGWQLGKLSGKIWVTNWSENKLIYPNELLTYNEQGYISGTMSRNKKKLREQYNNLLKTHTKEDVVKLLKREYPELSEENLISVIHNAYDKSIKTKTEKEALDELFEEHPEIIRNDENISYIKGGYPE